MATARSGRSRTTRLRRGARSTGASRSCWSSSLCRKRFPRSRLPSRCRSPRAAPSFRNVKLCSGFVSAARTRRDASTRSGEVVRPALKSKIPKRCGHGEEPAHLSLQRCSPVRKRGSGVNPAAGIRLLAHGRTRTLKPRRGRIRYTTTSRSSRRHRKDPMRRPLTILLLGPVLLACESDQIGRAHV